MGKLKIKYGDCNDLEKLYKIFERDFPASERKSLAHLKSLLSENYVLLLGMDGDTNEQVGYSLVYMPKGINTAWLDYIAIDEKYHGLGYGTEFINIIKDKAIGDRLGLFLEIEIDDGIDELKRRRIEFYKRLGAKKIDMMYSLPIVDGSFDMSLFFLPREGEVVLNRNLIVDTLVSVFNYIHSDINHRKAILDTFINSVPKTTLI